MHLVPVEDFASFDKFIIAAKHRRYVLRISAKNRTLFMCDTVHFAKETISQLPQHTPAIAALVKDAHFSFYCSDDAKWFYARKQKDLSSGEFPFIAERSLAEGKRSIMFTYLFEYPTDIDEFARATQAIIQEKYPAIDPREIIFSFFTPE